MLSPHLHVMEGDGYRHELLSTRYKQGEQGTGCERLRCKQAPTAGRDAACYRRNIGLPRVRDDRLDAIIHKCDNRRN